MHAPAVHLIDELAQETFVVAFGKIGAFQAGTSLETWLRAIAWQLLRREKLRFSRDQANKDRLAQFVSDRSQHDPAPSDNRFQFLDQCVAHLSSSQRDLLQLKYRDGHSSKEIAATFEQSEDWVRTTLYRTRNQLRQCIENKVQHQAHE